MALSGQPPRPFKLADAFLAIGRLHILSFALDDDLGIVLVVWVAVSEDDEVRSRPARPKAQRELDRDGMARVAVFSDEGFGDLLPNVLLWSLVALGDAVDEV